MDELTKAIIFENNLRTRERLLAMSYFIHGNVPPKQIASKLDCSVRSVKNWIKVYEKEGVAGLADKPRSGRPRKTAQAKTNKAAAKRKAPKTKQKRRPGHI